jgi:hypothetical protein
MPSVSKKQHNLMAAVANNPKFAKKTGIPQSVGKDFLEADKGKEFRKGGTTNPVKAKIANPRPRAGMLQMPNVSLKKYGFKDGGTLTNEKEKDMKKMNPGMMAMMAKKKPMKMAEGGMPMVMKDGKKVPAFAADGVGKMAMGGKAHSDMAKDKPMMKKVAASAVKGHEKKLHGMARGGGIEIKGKTKGTMVKMAAGGTSKKKYC